eukprot:3121567-Prymnesium_polylepis.1
MRYIGSRGIVSGRRVPFLLPEPSANVTMRGAACSRPRPSATRAGIARSRSTARLRAQCWHCKHRSATNRGSPRARIPVAPKLIVGSDPEVGLVGRRPVPEDVELRKPFIVHRAVVR